MKKRVARDGASTFGCVLQASPKTLDKKCMHKEFFTKPATSGGGEYEKESFNRRRKINGWHLRELEDKNKQGHRAYESIRLDASASLESQAGMQERTGYYGICDPCRRAGGYSHNCHNSIQAEIAGALGCNSRWNIEPLKNECDGRYLEVFTLPVLPHSIADHEVHVDATHGLTNHRMHRLQELLTGCLDTLSRDLKTQKGQSTVEFAVVFAALLCIVIGIGMFMNALQSGLFVEHAVLASSHNAEVVPGGATDVFCY